MAEPLATVRRPDAPAKHRLSVADFLRMAKAGILNEDDRIELIAGELIDMAPIGSRHVSVVGVLGEMLTLAIHGKAFVLVQSPVVLQDDSQPQPDIVLLQPREDRYASSLPRPADIMLVIEVADTSLEYDRDTKIPLYARSGIPEVWLVDLRDEVIEVYRDPGPTGYKIVLRPERHDTILPAGIPGVALRSDDLFR